MRIVQKKILSQGIPKNGLKITPGDLAILVPLYKKGNNAAEVLLEATITDIHEIHRLSNLVELQEYSLAKIVELSYPLFAHELGKMLASSRANDKAQMFYTLFFAGIDGLEKGLNKFDSVEFKSSSVSYLTNWFSSYAHRELMRQEATLGIPPNRYEKYKKIAAVRHKVSDEWGREVSNEELLEYFHSGQADVRSKKGRLTESNKPSLANQRITLDELIEQQDFEEKLHQSSLDENFDAPEPARLSDNPQKHVLGLFVQKYAEILDPDALTVLLSKMGYEVDTRIAQRKEARLWSLWQDFFTSKETVFSTMLSEVPERDVLYQESRIFLEKMKNCSQKGDEDRFEGLFLPGTNDISTADQGL